MKEVDPLLALRAFVQRTGTQRDAALVLGVSQQFLNDMLHDKRGISDKILTQLGLKRVTVKA